LKDVEGLASSKNQIERFVDENNLDYQAGNYEGKSKLLLAENYLNFGIKNNHRSRKPEIT